MKRVISLLVVAFLCSCAAPKKNEVLIKEAAVSKKINPSYVKTRPNFINAGYKDNLHIIAWRYHLDANNLAKLNKLSVDEELPQGQKILLSKANINHNITLDKQTINSQPQPTRDKTNNTMKANNIYKEVANVRWTLPASGRLVNNFSVTQKTINARGVEFVIEKSVDVKSAAKGKVVYCGNNLKEYGKLIIIQHNDKYLSAYAYNDVILVKEGQNVAAGEKIAAVGMNEGKKLHFEVREHGKPINPMLVLPTN